MTEPRDWDVPPEKRSLSSRSEHASSAIPRALWTAFAGHLVVLVAAATDSVPPNTASVAAIACSIIAVTALTDAAPEVRVRRTVTALIGGHGVAAAVVLAGIAPSVPRAMLLAALAAACALGAASLATVRHASLNRQPRPLALAPRVAAITLVVQALVQRWAASATDLSMSLRAAIVLAIAALGVALLASLSIIALRVRPRWAIAGLLAWTVGWVAITADLSSLILASLGLPLPTGPHRPGQLDAELVQILATLGGLAIGAALVTSIRDVRSRHSAVLLLAGYAAFGLVAIVAEHRIALATDFPSIASQRTNRDLAASITSLAFAGVLWLYWRRVVAPDLPRTTPRGQRA